MHDPSITVSSASGAKETDTIINARFSFSSGGNIIRELKRPTAEVLLLFLVFRDCCAVATRSRLTDGDSWCQTIDSKLRFPSWSVTCAALRASMCTSTLRENDGNGIRKLDCPINSRPNWFNKERRRRRRRRKSRSISSRRQTDSGCEPAFFSNS